MGVQDIMEQEMPQHPVHIDYSFGLGTYLITRSEFAAFVQKTGYDANGTCTSYDRLMSRKVRGLTWQHPVFIQTDRDPVVCVSKRDAEAYIAWLNTKVHGPSAKGGALYRLPSEAEWEYAARAGTKTAYWWGDSIGQNNAVCDVCGTHWDNKQTAPVGSFQANPFGLYDMNGNVWELTADCWSEGYSADAPSDGSPFVAANCSYYTMRGGSWGSDPWNLRSTGRGRASPEDRGNDIGFRVAREINQ
jgi:formylglycine-generating enzyme required for sulfatase activity